MSEVTENQIADKAAEAVQPQQQMSRAEACAAMAEQVRNDGGMSDAKKTHLLLQMVLCEIAQQTAVTAMMNHNLVALCRILSKQEQSDGPPLLVPDYIARREGS